MLKNCDPVYIGARFKKKNVLVVISYAEVKYDLM